MTPTPPLTERDLAFLEWLRGRGNLTVTEACNQGACLELDTDRAGVLYTLRKLVSHKRIRATIRKQRTNSSPFGGRSARIWVFHTGEREHG
ncbi:hypothetical protein M8828_01170 [Aeromonas simiae]|uniref:hypothetical protein n=1 Tax=Aeromonas simiae TaxID=218936 RepID=UPI00266BF750|nr:hypothetical protein [Aeromonas simiae]MDO2946973.1 hypothetical protein [Aeromonas simiae]MDO2954433.1 hypothetical protein [Aeromonas simiae]